MAALLKTRIFKQLGEGLIRLPAVGQGVGQYVWTDEHTSIIRRGIELGLSFIDTAEGYDDGRSEETVGRAIRGIRDSVVVGTKFSPEHSAYAEVLKAAEGSLRRLGVDSIDLYQVHWPNPAVAAEETLTAMAKLVESGKVRYIGLGNVCRRQVEEAIGILGEGQVATVQVEYNLFDRTIEDELLPLCQEHRLGVIAYSPLDRGRISDGRRRMGVIEDVARRYGRTPSQIALRWLIEKEPVVVIPKAVKASHVASNASAVEFDLDDADIQLIGEVCTRPVVYVDPGRIRVSQEGQDLRQVYQTLEEARENRLGFVPSPVELARTMEDERIKPVRLVASEDTTGRYDYELVEGRIRYWAWVIAKGNRPIPAYVRENWPN